jgi:L-serine dehydratase
VFPLFYPKKGEQIFTSAEEMVSEAEKKKFSLGKTCLEYETQLLGLEPEDALQHMMDRYAIMKASIEWGLLDENVNMRLLDPSASTLKNAEKNGRLVVGGVHSISARHALAVMHTCNSKGVICAAPTGGSSGVIPGILSALQEEKKYGPKIIARALFAAGGVGSIIARRATFAAEIAGCQVEIGAAEAMGAAAVVELAGGTPQQASDAAAISLQNCMGSVCDLVQGLCEIPCHTRNAAAASSAITCADLVLGGYNNPIPLDETIDAVYEVGKMMPRELRVTSLGGLSQTPSAQKMQKKE